MYSVTPGFDLMKALGLQNEAIRQQQQQQQQLQQQQPLVNDFSLSADLFASRPYGSCLNSLFSTNATDPYSIERAAKLYRNAACKYYYKQSADFEHLTNYYHF